MKKLVAFFGFVSKKYYQGAKDKIEHLEGQVRSLNRYVEGREKEVLELRLKNQKSLRVLPVVKVDAEDPSPKNEADRKTHIARVAAFHHDILDKKIMRMISDVREQVMQVGRETFGYSQEQFDLYLKGTENALWLIHQWGEEAIGEKKANDSGETDLTEKEREELKAKL